jgi:flagellar protein FliO/FliZ
VSGASTAALLARFAVSLVVVLGLLGVCAHLYRRGRSWTGGRRASAPVEVLARQPLSRRAQLVVVRAGERGLVLGVTDASVQLLGETDPAALAVPRHARVVDVPLALGAAGAAGAPVVEVTRGTASTRRPASLRQAGTALVEGLRERTVRRS